MPVLRQRWLLLLTVTIVHAFHEEICMSGKLKLTTEILTFISIYGSGGNDLGKGMRWRIGTLGLKGIVCWFLLTKMNLNIYLSLNLKIVFAN